MAEVTLSEVYEPATFAGLAQEAQLELNAFIATGVMITSPVLQGMVSQGGMTGQLTRFQALSNPEPNYSTDNSGSSSTPNNIDTEELDFRMAKMNQSWSVMDFAKELALQDPVAAITNRIGGYWATVEQTRVINACLGLLADNNANDGSDMVYSVATDAATAVTDAERISATSVMLAAQTMGDHKGSLRAIAMHSAVVTRLRIQNLIEYVRLSEQGDPIPFYLGYRVIEDDACPAVAGTNRITYTCVLFGEGVFAHADGETEFPSELYRAPAAGDGGGQSTLHSRVNRLIHPMGFDWVDNTRTAPTASYAELQLAANWSRVYDRKHIPIAFLQVNE